MRRKTTQPSGTTAKPAKLLRLTQLAALADVPRATVKHYLNEGLITVARKENARLALFDRSQVARIRAIKSLQRTRFLPLDVIKRMIDEGHDITDDDGAAVAISSVLAKIAPRAHRSGAGLVASGMPPEQLALLKSVGLLTPTTAPDGDEVYTGDDVELLRVLGRARRMGISPEMLPVSILETYVAAVRQLVKAELELFRAGVLPRAGADLAAVTAAATDLSEKLVVLIRRKLLVPTLRELASPPGARGAKRTRPPSRKA